MVTYTECHECGELVTFDSETGIYRCDSCGDVGLACSECFWASRAIDRCMSCRLRKSNFVTEQGRVA